MSQPDPVVSEETAREAIGRVAEGIRDTQIRAGVPVPDGAVDWAREIVREQVRKHEERANATPPAAPVQDPDEHPCRINNGRVGENTRVIAPDESARMRRHLLPKPPPLHIALLEGRLELIRYFPCEPGCTGPATDAGHVHPWNTKLIQAADDAVVWTRKSGWTDDDPRTVQRVADALMKVVELSGAPVEMGGLGLGDYKELRREMYVRMPRRGGLVPVSQLPKHAPPLVVAKDKEAT